MSQMLGAERIVKCWSLIDLICSYLIHILFDFPKRSVRLHDLQTDAKGLTSPCNSYQCHLQGNLNKMLVLATNHQQRLKIKAMEILKSKSRCPSIWMLKAKVNALHADAWDAAMSCVNQLWCVKMYQTPSRSKASRPLALPGDSQLFHRVRRENIQHATKLVPIWRDIQSNCAAHKKDQKVVLKEKVRDCNTVPACAGEAARNDRLSSELVQTDKAKAEVLSQTHMLFECSWMLVIAFGSLVQLNRMKAFLLQAVQATVSGKLTVRSMSVQDVGWFGHIQTFSERTSRVLPVVGHTAPLVESNW